MNQRTFRLCPAIVPLLVLLVLGTPFAASIGSATYNDESSGNANQMTGSRFLATESFTATEMKAQLTYGGGKLSMAIYSDNAQRPGSRLGQTVEIATTVTGWNRANLAASVTITQGSYYWLMFNNNLSGQEIGVNWGVGISIQKSRTYGSWPTSFGTGGVAWDGQAAILALGQSSVTPPSITSHPASQTVCEGSSVTFTVGATGTPPPSYQWRRNGLDISGAISASHSLTAQFGDSGSTYSCRVWNSAGEVVSNAATLRVKSWPSFTSHPVSQTTQAGQPVTFSVVVTGTPPMTYQWQSDGQNINGATSSSFTIASVSAADSGAKFRCVAENDCEDVFSQYATLSVISIVAPAITLHPQNQTVEEGLPVSFTIAATGSQLLSYQWERDGSTVPGATAPTYDLPVVELSDDGSWFICRVSNSGGVAVSDTARLTVTPPRPRIIQQPSDQSVFEGDMPVFVTSATGGLPLSYQWRKNGLPITGATGTQYVSPPVSLDDDQKTFDCVVSNSVGRDSTRAARITVSVRPQAPRITQHPSSIQGTLGDTVRFTVRAVGTAPLFYQWHGDSGSLAGQTDTVLRIGPLTREHDGRRYHCVVRNSVDSAISRAAYLTVRRPTSQQIIVSGELFDREGSPVGFASAAEMDFVVSLYPSIAGGAAVYTETFLQEHRQGVTVTGGKFVIRLGEGTSDRDLREVVTTNPNLFVSFTVTRPGGNPETLEPRTPLTAAPYALSSAPELLRGGGSPVSAGITAPIGTHYVDELSQKTFIRTYNGWVEIR